MSRISRGQWLTLTAALLGWAFDGFEMGVFPIVARPAIHDLLGRHVAEAVGRWPLLGVTIVHRYGRIVPGEDIVLVVTIS